MLEYQSVEDKYGLGDFDEEPRYIDEMYGLLGAALMDKGRRLVAEESAFRRGAIALRRMVLPETPPSHTVKIRRLIGTITPATLSPVAPWIT